MDTPFLYVQSSGMDPPLSSRFLYLPAPVTTWNFEFSALQGRSSWSGLRMYYTVVSNIRFGDTYLLKYVSAKSIGKGGT